MKPLKIICLTVGLLLATTTTGFSAEKDVTVENANKLVKDISDRAVKILDAPNKTKDQIKANIAALLTEVIDFKYLGRFALGRQGRKAKGKQFDEYIKLFAIHVTCMASDSLVELGVKGYTIVKSKKMADGDVVVSTEIQRDSGDPLKTGWRVKVVDDNYRISDMLFEGYSVGMHFRNKFGGLPDTSIGYIIQKLKNGNASCKSE